MNWTKPAEKMPPSGKLVLLYCIIKKPIDADTTVYAESIRAGSHGKNGKWYLHTDDGRSESFEQGSDKLRVSHWAFMEYPDIDYLSEAFDDAAPN